MRKKPLEKAIATVARSPIVSSAHLVSPKSAEMSEFEFGLIVAGNAFHRWIAHCMSAAGLKDLPPRSIQNCQSFFVITVLIKIKGMQQRAPPGHTCLTARAAAAPAHRYPDSCPRLRSWH